MDPVFQRTRQVEPQHIDALGHVNNVVWVRWIAALGEAHSVATGLDFERVKQLGGLWVVRRHEVSYLRSALPGATILEETWVSHARAARCLRHCRFSDEKGGVYVEARSEWAWVDHVTQRPRRMPKAVLDLIDVIPAAPRQIR
ncbi:MAG: acyl-CoA thioesterase [Myxococcota bacterium]|nr:acyl-CoA thioesterase [Myxococcota bacterium]